MLTTIQPNKFKKRLTNNYPFMIAIAVAFITLMSSFTDDRYAAMSLMFCIVNILFFSVYTAIYFKHFKLLDVTSDDKPYYYDVYNRLWFATFNILFLLNIAQFIYVFGRVDGDLYWSPAGNQPEIIFLFSVQSIINTVLLGFLDTFNLNPITVEFHGTLGRSLFFASNVVVELLIVANLFEIIQKARLDRRIEKNIRENGSIDFEYFKKLDSKKIRMLKSAIENNYCDKASRDQVLKLFSTNKSRDIRDMLLAIIQRTECPDEFMLCVDYFKVNRDRRFKVVARKLRDPYKQDILKQLQIDLNKRPRKKRCRNDGVEIH